MKKEGGKRILTNNSIIADRIDIKMYEKGIVNKELRHCGCYKGKWRLKYVEEGG